MNGKERRRHRRYKAPETCYAALKAGNTTVGRIRDISMGGLSFEYLEDEEKQGEQDGSELVDLFWVGGGYFIREIPCQTVRDSMTGHDALSFSGLGVRLRSLQFEALTDQASGQVEAYISCCSHG
ncbi:MAG: PilZ domain-containing protein [Desulfatibacillum sp.]|nr:PilZ domain-containing protein [Desulfatibacillum sp.]